MSKQKNAPATQAPAAEPAAVPAQPMAVSRPLFVTAVEDAPKVGEPKISDKTKAEMEVGRAILQAYQPAQD